MTEAQKFFFDLKGWLLVPGVLSDAEIEALKAHLYAGGDGYTGPAQELLDHPVVVDILNEILSTREPNEFMEPYSCPAGSVFIFTESLLHAATTWKNPEVDRVSIFNCYNSVGAQWHRLNLSHELIESMPSRR